MIMIRNLSMLAGYTPDQTAVTGQPAFVLNPDVPLLVLPVNVALSHLKIISFKTELLSEACKYK